MSSQSLLGAPTTTPSRARLVAGVLLAVSAGACLGLALGGSNAATFHYVAPATRVNTNVAAHTSAVPTFINRPNPNQVAYAPQGGASYTAPGRVETASHARSTSLNGLFGLGVYACSPQPIPLIRVGHLFSLRRSLPPCDQFWVLAKLVWFVHPEVRF